MIETLLLIKSIRFQYFHNFRKDIQRQEKKARGEDLDESETAVITALDLEDSWKKSAEGFTPASRTSEADLNNDVRSVKRAMDRPLRLLTKYQHGQDLHWQLPHAKHEEGESLRDTAERALIHSLGDGCKVTILGNAPWSFYKIKYPKHYQHTTDRAGAKVWIFKGILVNHFHDEDKISLNKNILDYQWSTRNELEEQLDKRIYRALDGMLHDEE